VADYLIVDDSRATPMIRPTGSSRRGSTASAIRPMISCRAPIQRHRLGRRTRHLDRGRPAVRQDDCRDHDREQRQAIHAPVLHQQRLCMLGGPADLGNGPELDGARVRYTELILPRHPCRIPGTVAHSHPHERPGWGLLGHVGRGRPVRLQATERDGSIIARVDRLDSVDPWSKAGVMIRNSLDASASWGYVLWAGEYGVRFQARLSLGATATSDTELGHPQIRSLCALRLGQARAHW